MTEDELKKIKSFISEVNRGNRIIFSFSFLILSAVVAFGFSAIASIMTGDFWSIECCGMFTLGFMLLAISLGILKCG